jgi:hypothetical protein
MLRIRDDNRFGTLVEGLKEFKVKDSWDCLNLMLIAQKNFARQKDVHTIFSLTLTTPDSSGMVTKSTFKFCDLAGAEVRD